MSNNFHCFSQVVEKLFTRFGVPLISDEEIRSSYISPYMKFWNQYIPDLSKTEQDILFLGCMQELERPKIYPGVMETLTFLHDHGRKLFVLSSDHADTLVPEIEHSGLLPLLTESISSDYEKGEQILTLIQRYALDQDATFLVGDTNGDIEAGIFAHVKTVGITW
ncbi:MAG: HAD hydrolase-like protein [bacterium]